MLSVVMLNVVMLSAAMLSAAMLNVVAPLEESGKLIKERKKLTKSLSVPII
jgi:hypothetical protein